MAGRCLIVSYYFPPVGGGGVQRITKLVKFLSRRGWDFTVVTAASDFGKLPNDASFLAEIPETTIIKRLPVREQKTASGILNSFSFLKKSTFINRWLSAFLYIPDMRKGWSAVVLNSVKSILDEKSYDCVLITAPPYSVGRLAVALTNYTKAPVILDMRDPWTTNPYKVHPTAWHLRRDRALEVDVISQVKYGISAYQSLIDHYALSITSFKKENWVCIPNGFDDEDFQGLVPETADKEFFNIGFSGTFYSHLNHPEPLFRAISKMKDEERGRIRFHHVGYSQINLGKLAQKFKLAENFKSRGYLKHKEALNALNTMDAFCFMLDDKNPDSGNTIGGKVYEYLRFKKPILALVPEEGEAAALIRQTNSGKVISPNNIQLITETLTEWVRHYPTFEYGDIQKYSRDHQAQMFEQFFKKAMRLNN